MTVARIGRPGKALWPAIAALFCALMLGGAAVANAQETAKPAAGLSEQRILELWDQLQSTPVSRGSCNACHKSLDVSQTTPREIIFSHGIHLGNYDCAACHSEFPHSAARSEIIVRPKMKECFACHGLRHGPMGQIAYNTCDTCHHTPRDRMRPSFHVYDWKRKPHVQPALDELQTKCMMCHDGPFCDDCHAKEYVRWEPDKPYTYDPGAEGCSQCHASSIPLERMTPGGPKSFRVTTVQESAHSQVSCIQCHADFKYDDSPNKTRDWVVNTGYACQDCHAKQKDPALSKAVSDYKASVHWLGRTAKTGLRNGDFKSPTCASCHGGHDISVDASASLRFAAQRTCARTGCHTEQYASYDDYYHGKAYKEGASDAPACWDCHEAHKILNSKNPASSVSKKNVGKTCGQERCHDSDRTGKTFGDRAGELIHQRAGTLASNPVVRFFRDLWPG